MDIIIQHDYNVLYVINILNVMMITKILIIIIQKIINKNRIITMSVI